MKKPCLKCGELTSNESYCSAKCAPKKVERRTYRDRDQTGRGTQWRNISKRARDRQRFCSDCGTRDDLTADHLPRAWHKILITRQPISLTDVSVVCRSCNAKRGPAQPGSKRYAEWAASVNLTITGSSQLTV